MKMERFCHMLRAYKRTKCMKSKAIWCKISRNAQWVKKSWPLKTRSCLIFKTSNIWEFIHQIWVLINQILLLINQIWVLIFQTWALIHQIWVWIHQTWVLVNIISVLIHQIWVLIHQVWALINESRCIYVIWVLIHQIRMNSTNLNLDFSKHTPWFIKSKPWFIKSEPIFVKFSHCVFLVWGRFITN